MEQSHFEPLLRPWYIFLPLRYHSEILLIQGPGAAFAVVPTKNQFSLTRALRAVLACARGLILAVPHVVIHN